ncbi:MAG: MFS transporter [Streptosporangiales bacterium]|nr:MFS transporter [Streptosporangiales bacterium]
MVGAGWCNRSRGQTSRDRRSPPSPTPPADRAVAAVPEGLHELLREPRGHTAGPIRLPVARPDAAHSAVQLQRKRDRVLRLILYVIAASVVFPYVFFSNLSPTMATIASFVTLAVGYVGRPLGGVIFGHFGDKLGRKGVLVTTMLLMGISTMAIGFLPPAALVGVTVPILDVLRRYPRQAALGIIVAISQLTIDGVATSWAVNHTVELGVDSTTVLNLKILGSVALLIAAVISARLSDRWGRRLPLAAGIVAALIFMFPMLNLIQTGTAGGFAAAVIIGQFIQGFILGPLAAFLAELFPTRLRFTGASLCFQTAAALGSVPHSRRSPSASARPSSSPGTARAPSVTGTRSPCRAWPARRSSRTRMSCSPSAPASSP